MHNKKLKKILFGVLTSVAVCTASVAAYSSTSKTLFGHHGGNHHGYTRQYYYQCQNYTCHKPYHYNCSQQYHNYCLQENCDAPNCPYH